MLLQYCAPLHLQLLNVRSVCAGLLHLEHKTMELSVKLEDEDVVFIPSISSSRLRFAIASSSPCFAAWVIHSIAFVNDCVTPLPRAYKNPTLDCAGAKPPSAADLNYLKESVSD